MTSDSAESSKREGIYLKRAWRLVEALRENNQFVSIIVTHTFIESTLVELIRGRLQGAHQLTDDDFDRMGFAQILKLALAVQAVQPDLKGALIKLNAYRNSFAHDIDHTVLTDEQIRQLDTTLPKAIRDSIHRGMQHNRNAGLLSEVLFALSADLVRSLDGESGRDDYFDIDRRTLGVIIEQNRDRFQKKRSLP